MRQTNYNTIGGSPGEVLLKLFMQPLGLSAYRVAEDLAVAPIAVSQILRGRRAISPVMALKLETYFGVEAKFWLMLQAAHEIKSARQEQRASIVRVERCAALAGKEFSIKETRTAAARRYEVALLKASPSGTDRKGAAPKPVSS